MAPGAALTRGEIWWAAFAPPDKTRPVVLVSRSDAYARRELVVVASITTRIRQIPTEVPIGRAEGLARPSVVNCDDLRTIPKRVLLRPIGALSAARRSELD